jgi:Transcriptional repressor TCF25
LAVVPNAAQCLFLLFDRLTRSALALSRYILSLDPLRDPTGVLLALDHYALASDEVVYDQWLVELVESDSIQVWYRDEGTGLAYRCGLLELPNWAFSYALALFRNQYNAPSDVPRLKADEAIQKAMSRFPAVVGLLLQDNEVDTTGRSFRRDWSPVLDFAWDRSRHLRNAWLSASNSDTISVSATLQASELIVKIFVKLNARLWGRDEVLQWMYSNLKILQSTNPGLPVQPDLALVRYIGCDPSDFDNIVHTLPPDVNIIDAGLIAHAMAMVPNRPRLLRRMQRGAGADVDEHVIGGNDFRNTANPILGGPPTHVVDPDLPLAEVFWRSFLPWSRVEGVPPPRR